MRQYVRFTTVYYKKLITVRLNLNYYKIIYSKLRIE